MRHRQQQERADRRAALAAWLLANINRDTEHRSQPFDLEEVVEWLGYASSYVRQDEPEEEPDPPPAAKLLQQVELLNQLYGGVDMRNGTKKD